MLSSTIDIFDMRTRAANASSTALTGDLGLLHAVDERLAAYGFESTTGVRFVVVVDMRGGKGRSSGGMGKGVGLREGELKPVSLCCCCLWLYSSLCFLGKEFLKHRKKKRESLLTKGEIKQTGLQGASVGVHCATTESFLRSG